MREYDFALGARAILFFQRVNKRERELLLRSFERLVQDPQQPPDGILPTRPREICFKYFSAFRICYWVDHAECEVRITDIPPK